MLKASIYVDSHKDPVMNISLLELTQIKNSYLSQIVLRQGFLKKQMLRQVEVWLEQMHNVLNQLALISFPPQN